MGLAPCLLILMPFLCLGAANLVMYDGHQMFHEPRPPVQSTGIKRQPVGAFRKPVQRRDEKHQLVGAFRGVVISVHEKIPLEMCSVLCTMDPGCEAYEYNVTAEGTCHLLNGTSSAARTLLPNNETRIYVKVRGHWAENVDLLSRIIPDFYEDFEDVNRMTFHNGAGLADGKFGLAATTNASQNQWIELGDLSHYSCIVKPSTCGATGGGSIGVWIKFASCENTGIITSLTQNGAQGIGISKLRSEDYSVTFRLNLKDEFYVFHGEIPADTWNQVVMIYNGFHGGVRIYVNGEVKNMEEKERNGRTENSGDVVIGRRYVERDSGYCSGMVDELMLWNRSLTNQEAEYFISLY